MSIILSFPLVDDNGSPELVTFPSSDGANWPVAATSQFSSVAPSLAALNGRIYMAFLSNDPSNRLLVMSSPDGKTWTGGTPTNQYSSAAPSLAFFNGQLHMAFVANDPSGRLLVMSSGNGTTWTGGTPSGQTSLVAPALAVAPNGDLYMAFSRYAEVNESIVFIVASGDGVSWPGEPFTGPLATQIFRPALAAF